ncbi:MAG: hypothetical protein AAGF77_06900 [Bacteroidota bacterium]
MLQYLCFLLKSTNEHGVHSPFVFDYLTKCLYAKPKKSSNKLENLILKSVDYFSFQQVTVKGNLKLEDTIATLLPKTSSQLLRQDLFLFTNDAFENATDSLLQPHLHNESMLIFDGIRTSRESFLNWQRFKAHPQLTVTIDFYRFGIAFLRREQQKEHFILRC